MQSPFFDRHELAAYLHMPERPARALLEAHGVLPINADIRGRKTRLLWSRQDVIRVSDTLLARSRSTPAEYVPPRKGSKRLAGKDVNTLFAELTQ